VDVDADKNLHFSCTRRMPYLQILYNFSLCII